MNKVELFFYNREEKTVKEGKEITLVHRESFNTSFIVKSVQVFEGEETAVIVILNDIHEEMRLVPVQKDKKTIHESRKIPVQTQIVLTGADVERFYKRFDETEFK